MLSVMHHHVQSLRPAFSSLLVASLTKCGSLLRNRYLRAISPWQRYQSLSAHALLIFRVSELPSFVIYLIGCSNFIEPDHHAILNFDATDVDVPIQ